MYLLVLNLCSHSAALYHNYTLESFPAEVLL